MATARAPKQWPLTKNETVTSFESWRQNLIYILSLDINFTPFLSDGVTWQKKTAATPTRGLVDDVAPIPADQRKSATMKNTHLDLMLGQIANYCTVIARSTIVKGSTSLTDIWQKIREHYGFQSTGAHFLDLASIALQPGERHEDLYQRLMAFYEDNLLQSGGGITHHGEQITVDEDLTPTLENTIVFMWLQLIHPALPKLVKQKYGAELRNKSLASLKPEISIALTSLLDEIRTIEDTQVLRTSGVFAKKKVPTTRGYAPRRPPFRSCTLCKAAGRPGVMTHNLFECKYLPASDKRSLAMSRLVTDDGENADLMDDTSDDTEPYMTECDVDLPSGLLDQPSAHRVRVIQSPFLNTYYEHFPVRLTLDTGATTNMIRAPFARSIGLPIAPASQVARQADGVTPLSVVGEVHCQLTRGSATFQLDALVVQQLDVDVLAGNPFLATNDVATRPAKHQIVLNGSEIIHYGDTSLTKAAVRRTQSYLLRCPPRQTVLLPGEYIQLPTPESAEPDTIWALEPRLDSPCNHGVKPDNAWPKAQEICSVSSTLRITNATSDPVVLRRNEHVCQIRPITTTPDSIPHLGLNSDKTTPICTPCKPYSACVSLDPNECLSQEMRGQFRALNLEYDEVFNPAISKYNGASGSIEAIVNMGPTLPPQRKGRLPQYNHDKLVALQNKFDDLEAAGVFTKPERVNVSVEYLNLSFLIQKPNGGNRLVTSFGEVGQYSKPQPSLMPNVDNVLRDIAKWNYIVVSDLAQSFYQIPLAKSSMKYCGVATPFKGIRVYTRSAMGMPGSETCLEELMCRVLGELIQEGCAAKIADDLYCGGATPEEALSNWARVLEALQRNNLRLSATKTVICPRSTTILGWIWTEGTLRASTHKVAALASVQPPATVQGLRSFVGAYKVLSRVLRGYADLLHPLDRLTAGKQSTDKIVWSEELLHAFKQAQEALKDNKAITVPRPDDCLWIVTDGSVKQCGIAATMYALRNDQLVLSGFFNAKLRKHQVNWLPCEIEALCIGSAVKHFSPYITQAKQTTQVLTDSRPCVQAYDKLQRGEFSASSRVTTFLSTVSRYFVQVRHISGAANLPSDFASRNPIACSDSSCQICRFIQEDEDSVVRELSVKDVTQGSFRMPFTSRAAWMATQQECSDLRRTHAHLAQGTRPSKKLTKIPDVKRYLKSITVARDSLLVVRDNQPFQPTRERIVVPRSVVDGLVTAIHIRFGHPTFYQTRQLVIRYFFALDLDKAIHAVNTTCHHCASLRTVPTHLHPQSTSVPPDSIGVTFAADVMRRYRQHVLVLRETVSSFTLTTLIEDERSDGLRDGLLFLCSEVRCLGDGGTSIRVDSAPGLVSLVNDPMLEKHGITLEVGNVKNVNKNPVAERAIQELGLECLHIYPEGGPLSKVTLALATARMNSRIRQVGLSARELWTQRDQLTCEQLPIQDQKIILQQHTARAQNHPFSAKSKAHGKTQNSTPDIKAGDLVFLYADRDKTRVRDKYIVVGVSGAQCQIRKFTKSQFRSKVYDVKVTDCYPVMSNALARSPPGPIRGFDHCDTSEPDSDSDTELDQAVLPGHHNTPLPSAPHACEARPPLPVDIVTPPACETATNGGTPSQPPTHETLYSPSSRPSRTRKVPSWQTSGSWIMQ